MTETEGALLAMKETGRVIIGIPEGFERLPKGYMLYEFAGRLLRGYELHITGRASRKDWDSQVRLFGFVDRNERTKGEKFYTAVLVERPK